MVGLMPHPEHAIDPLTGPSADGLGFFTSAVAAFAGAGWRRAAGAGVGAVSDKDTVEVAEQTPDQHQPYKELGLTDDEYAKVRDILGRRPTAAELALYSVMWSEHCSYKSSKVHLRNLAPDADQARHLLAGIGANAGVVDIGQGYAVTFKIESHNHPSFVEPHQGAATGIGGIVRDIIAMGARPIAVMDALQVRPGRRARHRPGAARRRLAASRSTATAWACPTSAASSSSTPATPGTRW